jgi:hypothetical protein
MHRALTTVVMTLLVSAVAVAAEETTVEGACMACHK